ncbi:MAG: hypothetical protein GX799_04555 [Crenarchaeota archaeon]|nr:hypothetical protein [Thermoproteota archaeon]
MASSIKKPCKIILDSNAFFVPLKFKLDIFQGIKQLLQCNVEFILLSPIKQELEILANVKEHKQAHFALKLAEKCKVVIVEGHKENTDDIIVRVAKKWNTPVFTNDRELKRRLRDISVPVIYLRQKSRLYIDGLIS